MGPQGVRGPRLVDDLRGVAVSLGCHSCCTKDGRSDVGSLLPDLCVFSPGHLSTCQKRDTRPLLSTHSPTGQDDLSFPPEGTPPLWLLGGPLTLT